MHKKRWGFFYLDLPPPDISVRKRNFRCKHYARQAVTYIFCDVVSNFWDKLGYGRYVQSRNCRWHLALQLSPTLFMDSLTVEAYPGILLFIISNFVNKQNTCIRSWRGRYEIDLGSVCSSVHTNNCSLAPLAASSAKFRTS